MFGVLFIAFLLHNDAMRKQCYFKIQNNSCSCRVKIVTVLSFSKKRFHFILAQQLLWGYSGTVPD